HTPDQKPLGRQHLMVRQPLRNCCNCRNLMSMLMGLRHKVTQPHNQPPGRRLDPIADKPEVLQYCWPKLSERLQLRGQYLVVERPNQPTHRLAWRLPRLEYIPG